MAGFGGQRTVRFRAPIRVTEPSFVCGTDRLDVDVGNLQSFGFHEACGCKQVMILHAHVVRISAGRYFALNVSAVFSKTLTFGIVRKVSKSAIIRSPH